MEVTVMGWLYDFNRIPIYLRVCLIQKYLKSLLIFDWVKKKIQVHETLLGTICFRSNF